MAQTFVDFTLKLGDERPQIEDTLYGAPGVPFALSDYEMTCRIARASNGEVVAADAAVEVVDAAGGIVRYTPTDAVFDRPGMYFLTWRATLGGTGISFPTQGYVRILVEPSI